MSHNIDVSTGKPAMAYVGPPPWHELGEQVKKGASVQEMRRKGQLDWRVRLSQVKFDAITGDKQVEQIDNWWRVMYRSDTRAVLDIVGPEYVPFQNEEVLAFFQEYVEAGEMYLETVGSLNGGRQVWALANMEDSFDLRGKDKVEGRILLMNPHQYGKGALIKFTPIRVVCWNTLMMAIGGGGDSLKLWHTSEFNKERQDEAKRRLGLARDRFQGFKHDAKTLSLVELTHEDALKILAKVMKSDTKKPLEEQPRTVQRIFELYSGVGYGSQLASAKDTAWGLLNAVTQYYDHEYGRSVNSRIQNSWFGSGDQRKRGMFVELLQLATENAG